MKCTNVAYLWFAETHTHPHTHVHRHMPTCPYAHPPSPSHRSSDLRTFLQTIQKPLPLIYRTRLACSPLYPPTTNPTLNTHHLHLQHTWSFYKPMVWAWVDVSCPHLILFCIEKKKCWGFHSYLSKPKSTRRLPNYTASRWRDASDGARGYAFSAADEWFERKERFCGQFTYAGLCVVLGSFVGCGQPSLLL